jgi:3-phosphoshikimate 1-carboxyvinyltransferase
MKSIKSFKFDHKITVNASKSHLQRALALCLLSDGKSTLLGCDESNDVLACKKILHKLGCEIHGKDILHITPPKFRKLDTLEISVGESGLALRMFSFVAKLFSQKLTIQAEGSLVNRPIDSLIHSLEKTGLQVILKDGVFPIEISSEIHAEEIHLDGSFSSQMLTGLLISAPLLPHDTIIYVENLTSKPYIDLTIQTMRDFGIGVSNQNYTRFSIHGNQKYLGQNYQIEGDWSGASNHIVGAAISGAVNLMGLQEKSTQADFIILSIIQEFGANYTWENGNLQIRKSELKNPINVDLTNNPDLFPILAILACAAKGSSKFNGTNRLLHKESNRLNSVKDMLSIFGVDFTLSENQITIHGTGKIKGGKIQCYNDHRIAMAATIAATISDYPIEIDNAECIAKSYPNFFNDLGL